MARLPWRTMSMSGLMRRTRLTLEDLFVADADFEIATGVDGMTQVVAGAVPMIVLRVVMVEAAALELHSHFTKHGDEAVPVRTSGGDVCRLSREFAPQSREVGGDRRLFRGDVRFGFCFFAGDAAQHAIPGVGAFLSRKAAAT